MKLLVLLLALVFISEISSVKLRKSGDAEKEVVLNKLRQLGETSEEMFSAVATIEMQLSTGNDKIGKIVAYIKALEDYQGQKVTKLKSGRTTKQNEYDEELSGINSTIHDDNVQLEKTNKQIDVLSGTISTLNKKIDSLSIDIQNLVNRKAALIDAHSNDGDSYAKRKARDEAAIQGLNQIIGSLNNLLTGEQPSSQLSKTGAQVLDALKNVPQGNFLEAFIQASTRFNPTQVKFVIGKLTEIRDSIIASHEDDGNKEGESDGRYNALLAEVEKVFNSKVAEKKAALKAKRIAEKEKDFQIIKKGNLEGQIEDSEALYTVTENQMNTEIGGLTAIIDNQDETFKALGLAIKYLQESPIHKAADQAGIV